MDLKYISYYILIILNLKYLHHFSSHKYLRGVFYTPALKRLFLTGVLRLVHITAGGDFLGLCDQKSSYKHVSDFGRLRSYDRLKLRRQRLLTINGTK